LEFQSLELKYASAGKLVASDPTRFDLRKASNKEIKSKSSFEFDYTDQEVISKYSSHDGKAKDHRSLAH
jgi:hypothetical protein